MPSSSPAAAAQPSHALNPTLNQALNPLSGETRVYLIVGDPITQVKAPAGVTAALQQRGVNGVVLPFQVSVADFAVCITATSMAKNLDGIIVTVPHKFAATALCATLSPRAKFLDTVNMMRRNPDGQWHGDMCDGLGMVKAIANAGCQVQGKRVLLIGAGGAGSAIGHAVAEAGAAALAIVDASAQRLARLVQRLSTVSTTSISTGSPSAADYDIVINATPMGMQAGDPLPFDVTTLSASCLVADVITQPVITPALAAAQARGCVTVTGVDMFECVRDRLVDFYVG
jgi:shikimate dehydrogenase